MRILVVSINGLDSPKLESVTIPTSLPFNAVDFFLRSCNAKDTKSSESRSPKETK